MIASEIPSREDLQTALELVTNYSNETPVFTCSRIDELCGSSIFFKCENFQKVGAFKFRGAINTVMQLKDEEVANGIATHSSGNHGQAVALAAKIRGIPAFIVMPENSTRVKIDAVRSYGAEVVFCDNSLQAREDKLEEVLVQKDAYFIHPYDDWRVIAGQSTASQELIKQSPDLDIIITPIGGGGLISGTALAANYFSPNVRVYGSEPHGADSAYRSVEGKQWIKVDYPETVCDGLRASIGEKNFEVISRYVDKIFRVSDHEAIHAMKLIWQFMKIVIEPSCAVPLAAILANPDQFSGKKVGVILTGGNIDLDSLSDFFKSTN